MASLNKVMLIGHAGKDSDLRYTANGTAKAEFSLAVNGWGKDAPTEWFNIVIFGETAERVSQYITKGKPLYIEGRLQTRSWDDDQGVKRYRTEVIGNQIQLLGSRDDDAGQGGGQSNGTRGSAGGGWNDNPAPRQGQQAQPRTNRAARQQTPMTQAAAAMTGGNQFDDFAATLDDPNGGW